MILAVDASFNIVHIQITQMKYAVLVEYAIASDRKQISMYCITNTITDAILGLHVTSSFSQIQNYRATNVFILIRHKRG